jgi:hypothetical protein
MDFSLTDEQREMVDTVRKLRPTNSSRPMP